MSDNVEANESVDANSNDSLVDALSAVALVAIAVLSMIYWVTNQ